MSTQIIEGVDTDTIELLDFEHVPPCEAEYDDGVTCENEAKFICMVRCCGNICLFCEECFFGFVEYAKRWQGREYICKFCEVTFEICPEHLKVVGRV